MKKYAPLWLGALTGLAFCGAAHGTVTEFTTTLSGLSESPPNASSGAGWVEIRHDADLHTLQVDATFADLVGLTTAAHIHAATLVPFAGTAGVATQVPTFSGFPLGVTSGSYSHVFDLTEVSSFHPSYVTAHGGTASGAELALIDALEQGRAYFNVHTSGYPGGEIRGFLSRVPDTSATLTLLALPLLLLVGWQESRRRGARERRI